MDAINPNKERNKPTKSKLLKKIAKVDSVPKTTDRFEINLYIYLFTIKKGV